MRLVGCAVSDGSVVPVIDGLLSEEVADLYGRHVVRLVSVDRDGLVELGFRRASYPGAEDCEIWTRRVPDTFGHVMSLAVHVPEDPSFSGVLYGIVEGLPTDAGWAGEDFSDFCLSVHCALPDGSPGNDDAVLFIDDTVRRMLSAGAIVPREAVRWPGLTWRSSTTPTPCPWRTSSGS